MRTAKDNLWLEGTYDPAPPIMGEHETDVAIIGGGLTGLAAAYFIKRCFPEKRIIVLESEFIGYGSSGRNTGIVSITPGNSIAPLLKKHGLERTSQVQRLAFKSVALVEELIREHHIDCDYDKPGRIILAESSKAARLLEKEADACGRIDVRAILLDSGRVREFIGCVNPVLGLLTPDEGTINPVKFVRGLKKVVESSGVEVYEHSRCDCVEPGPVISVYTPTGRVRARDIVLATNAYSNPLGLFRHKVLPFYVYNIATEPLSRQQMDAFHWSGRVPVFNHKNLFWTLRLTADNRLVFIEVDAPYFYNVDRDYSHRPREYKSHHRLLTKMFPFLRGIKITHQWGGRLGMTLDFLPSIGRMGKHGNIYYSMGYNGHGVAFSQVAGKMIAGLMAGEESELTDNMLINRSLWGIPSASVSYFASNGYKLYFKLCDWLMDIGK